MRQKNKLAIGKYTKENTVKRTFKMQSVGAEFGEEGNYTVLYFYSYTLYPRD